MILVIEKKQTANLVVECDSSVHMGAFLLVVTGCLHHVLWVTEQSQVHQLVIQTVLLFTHNKSQEVTERDGQKLTNKLRESELSVKCNYYTSGKNLL